MSVIADAWTELGPEQLGGKAAGLARLERSGFQVPPWFALTGEAFLASLPVAARRMLLDGHPDPEVLARSLADLTVCPAVLAELRDRVAVLCPRDERLAVRSSSVEEDGASLSFAGQLESFLDVSPDEVSEHVVRVWRSAFAPRVEAYRRRNGVEGRPPTPAVIVQRMVDADAAGVAFGADPISGRRAVAVVTAVSGLAASLVSGECDADTYRVSRDGRILERRAESELPSGAGDILSDAAIRAVATVARAAGRCFGQPQDIEWAMQADRLHVLQARPITTLAATPDPDGALNIWDNANIIESYPGVTTPLTFSFARHVYREVYRQLSLVMGVPASVVAAHDDTYRCMLGLIRGRVYYNLTNWYRLLALLPGVASNRRLMEQMMGVGTALPAERLRALAGEARGRGRARLGLLRIATALMLHYLRLPGLIRRFHRRIERVLADGEVRLEDMRADELAHVYRDLLRDTLASWDAPLVNDLFVMFFHGWLRNLVRRWFPAEDQWLYNALLVNQADMVSTEPVALIRKMGEIAAEKPELAHLLSNGSRLAIERRLRDEPRLRRLYRNYLDRFGDRCHEELKLESSTLAEQPLPLLRAIGEVARHLPRGCDPAGERKAPDLASEAGARVRTALRGHPLRRLLFAWVRERARERMRDRENLRFERTRVFGRVRCMFQNLGRRLAEVGAIDDVRDIFYLETDEALGVIEATSTSTDLRAIVRARRREFDDHRRSPGPPPRFETRGIPHLQTPPFTDTGVPVSGASDCRQGLGCCPGVVRGRVRLVSQPQDPAIQPGEILVAQHTDPGWVILLSTAAGLLVERGSLLSHSAIIARELGIPTIVGVGDAMDWLRTGQWVELDGAAGVVRRIAAPAATRHHPPACAGSTGGR